MQKVRLRAADEADIDFMMRTERLPGYEWFVGQWDAERHRAALADDSNAYLVGVDQTGEPIGFAMFRQLDDPEKNIYLQRFLVEHPGRGLGGAFLRAVTAWAFRDTLAHRMWLQVKDGNDRALAVYHRCGFVTEGRLREAHISPDGTRSDSHVLSMLRAEWSSRPASATT